MKGIIVAFSVIVFGCTSTIELNEILAHKKMSLVKETHYSPYSNSTYGFNRSEISQYSYYFATTLLKINGKEIEYYSRKHEILEGKNQLLVECRISTSTSGNRNNKDIYNTILLEVILEQGHIYKLKPVKVNSSTTNNESCNVILNDLTII